MDFKALSQKQAAEALGVSTRSLRNWGLEGLPRNGDGTYSLPNVFTWVIERHDPKGPEDAESSRWLAELRKERALMARLDRQKLEETLIPRADIVKMWVWRMGEVTSGLASLVARISPLLEGKTRAEMRAVLDREIWRLRDNYCRTGRFCTPPDEPKKGSGNGAKKG